MMVLDRSDGMASFRDITDDESFVDELRVTLRFLAAVLVRRTQKVINSDIIIIATIIVRFFVLFLSLFSQVDVASVITRKLLKVSMKHIEMISKARQKGTADFRTPVTLSPDQRCDFTLVVRSSKEHRVPPTSCPGRVRSGSPRGAP